MIGQSVKTFAVWKIFSLFLFLTLSTSVVKEQAGGNSGWKMSTTHQGYGGFLLELLSRILAEGRLG